MDESIQSEEATIEKCLKDTIVVNKSNMEESCKFDDQLEINKNLSDGKEESVYYVLPKCLNKWNWGAFLLGWIWAIGNRVRWGLFALIPCVGFAVRIVLAIYGSKSAWDKYSGFPEEFDATQELWTKYGVIVLIFSIELSFLISILVLSSY